MGMSTRVGRRVTRTKCKCIVVEGNDVVSKDITVFGNYDNPEKATKALKNHLGIERVLVESVERTSAYYSMPIERFVELADQTTDERALDENDNEDSE